MYSYVKMMETFVDIKDKFEEVKIPEQYKPLIVFDEEFERLLAYWEWKLLTDDELIERGGYFSKINNEETFHSIICKSTGNILSKKRSKKTSEYFKKRLYSTGYATHGLFPYRGKFHPQMIKAILNATGIKRNEIVLDPMCGSGTLNVEASLIGVNSIGFDKNPFAAFMAKVKTESLKLERSVLKEKLDKCQDYFSKFNNQTISIIELIKSDNDEDKVNRLCLLSYLDAIGFSRRVKAPVKKLFPNVYNRYLNQVYNFLKVKDKLGMKFGKSSIKHGDAMDLGDLKSNSIDGIITSPPYSFAIDYAYNDRPQIEFLGYDVNKIKEEMIGLKGRTKEDKLKIYFSNMDNIISEMKRVLKSQKFLTIIIGSNTKQTGGIKLEKKIIKSAEDKDLNLKKEIDKSIKGIRNTMETEKILIFRKES